MSSIDNSKQERESTADSLYINNDFRRGIYAGLLLLLIATAALLTHTGNTEDDNPLEHLYRVAKNASGDQVMIQRGGRSGTVPVEKQEDGTIPPNAHPAEPPVERQCGVDACDLNETTNGVPVILISFGRSGSTTLWQILWALLSDTPVRHVPETIGSKRKKTASFMEEQEALYGPDSPCWLVRMLCGYQQEAQRQAAIIFGTKIKPHFPTFNVSVARSAWQWLGSKAQQHAVKVIYNERNPLDLLISKTKHHAHHKELQAHCSVGNDKCLAKHASAQFEFDLDTLVNDLQKLVTEQRGARQVLAELHVPHVAVRYEALFWSGENDASEWQRILDHLGMRSRFDEPLTRQAVQGVTEFAATSTPSNRNRTVLNYDQVVQTLQGTVYEQYL